MTKEQELKEMFEEIEKLYFKMILEYAKMQEINKRNCFLSIMLIVGITANIVSAVLCTA